MLDSAADYSYACLVFSVHHHSCWWPPHPWWDTACPQQHGLQPGGRRLVPHRSLTTKRRHRCTHCPYSTARKHSLTVHMRTHTGEKPFLCPHCPYRCSKKVNLKIHIRTHTGEKPFTCQQCSFRSAQKVNLLRHLQTHAREMGRNRSNH